MDLGIYVIAILLGLEGLINLCGVLIPIQNMSKYTDESVKAWCRPNGLVSIIVAAGLAMFNAYMWGGINNQILLIGGIGLIVIGCIGTFIIIKKYLVKS